MIFLLQSKFDDILKSALTSIPENWITTNFCSAHDMIAVMSHAKFCGDHLITIWYLNVDHMTEKIIQSYVHFYGIYCSVGILN